MYEFSFSKDASGVLKNLPGVLMDIENDHGPTLEMFEKIAKPFGLKISFVRPPKRDQLIIRSVDAFLPSRQGQRCAISQT